MLILATFSLALCLILIILNSLISKKSPLDREKSSPFECGFEPKNSSRVPFSLRFYLIAIIFLIFDVEIALILPVPLLSEFMQNSALAAMIIYFILILTLGLLHEWKEGALEWDS